MHRSARGILSASLLLALATDVRTGTGRCRACFGQPRGPLRTPVRLDQRPPARRNQHPGPRRADRIGPARAPWRCPPARKLIDLGSATCLPGLIDSHTHLTGQTSPTSTPTSSAGTPPTTPSARTVYARRTLLAGFTTVRNLGDGANASIALRNAINAGVVTGPRIFTAGGAIGSTGGHADDTDGYRADLQGDPQAAERHHQRRRRRLEGRPPALQGRRRPDQDHAVRRRARRKQQRRQRADDRSTRSRRWSPPRTTTASPSPRTRTAPKAIRRAVVGGVDSIEHGTFMDDADMKLMKEHGTWYVPTIIAGKYVAGNGARARLLPAAGRRQGDAGRAADPGRPRARPTRPA